MCVLEDIAAGDRFRDPRCVGASQETTVKERVAFLRMAEEGLLEDMREVGTRKHATTY